MNLLFRQQLGGLRWWSRWWQQTINQQFQQARSRNWSWSTWFWQNKQAFQAMRGVTMYINN